MPDDPARSSEAAGQPIPEEDRPVDVPALHAEIRALLKAVREEGRGLVRQWEGSLHQPDFRPGAENLACYLALRHRDLRPLQRPLMLLGLSSLGRLESRVLPVLESVERALAALAGRGDHLLLDADSHASIYDGARLAGAQVTRFRHNDPDDLRRRLRLLDDRPGEKLVVVEGIYSMLGDTAPLREIAEVKRDAGAWLLVDEAHSIGVLGATGRFLLACADESLAAKVVP